MALSKAKLKAATEKYKPLIEGQSEEDAKKVIGAEFTDEATLDEIYYAIAAAGKATYYIVIAEFRDINDFDKKWEVGSDVTHFEQSRLDDLESKGLVEKQ